MTKPLPSQRRRNIKLAIDILVFIIGMLGWIGIIASYFDLPTFEPGVVFILFALGSRVASLEEKR